MSKTIIVYLADHGDYLMDYGLARKGVGLFECLTRIPMVWSGYRIQPSSAGKSAFVSMADVMPTLCEAMGAEIPHGVQGRSLWPLLTGQSYPAEEFRSIYSSVGLGGLYYVKDDNIPYSSATLFNGKPTSGSSIYGIGWDECVEEFCPEYEVNILPNWKYFTGCNVPIIKSRAIEDAVA